MALKFHMNSICKQKCMKNYHFYLIPFAVAVPLITPDDKIVLIGGNSKNKNKMIIYDPMKNCYEIFEIIYAIDRYPCVAFDIDNNLHIIGGGSDSTQHLVMNWKDKSVTKLSNAPLPIKKSGICCDGEMFYVCGALDTQTYKSNKFLRYNTRNKKWHKGPDMPHETNCIWYSFGS